MMRTDSAAVVKGRKRGPLYPREGTKIRAHYDLFVNNKGLPVVWHSTTANLIQLRDIYGLDIRRLRNGLYVLAGEWFGKVYVDYIAEQLKKENKG